MFYEESDIAECRCGGMPEFKGSETGGYYVRCPECGIKTGTSTAGLESVLPVWNRIMDDAWPASDPKRGA